MPKTSRLPKQTRKRIAKKCRKVSTRRSNRKTINRVTTKRCRIQHGGSGDPVSISFEIYENDEIADFEKYSGQEIDSLQNTLDEMFLAIERVTVILPDDGTTGTIIFQHGMPDDWSAEYLGKKIEIFPPQYGLSPWPDKVEVKFIDPTD